ncbi:replication initiation protein [Pseudomonas aeruginosa]|uniref:replication initiation protein n=1 Tax=Pseudomonas aeruginosa TaxID=287 RepID=UPI00053E78E8|nr:replication initiation protein [Pseudomonas aeruginosa]HBN9772285.1 replication initiation protein [Pseudomonas aeruginosa]HBN9778251.1 replication initiation protein [Pseudomonas aeruginosa]
MEALDLFRQRLGRRPYCSDNLATDGLYRLPVADALTHQLIQPNTAKRMVCLAFDVDRPAAAIDWSDRNAPAPTMTVMNPANGHAHLVYLLADPVPVSDASRIKPVRYLAAIQEGIRRSLDADRGYAGLIVKNPLHAHWVTRQWADAYSLDGLAANVELPTPAEMKRRAKQADYAGLGRNCTLFEIVRRQAYSVVRDYWRPGGAAPFAAAVLALVEAANTDFAVPLSVGECRAIARSISRWVWQRFTPDEFRAIQAARGSKKGATKREQLMPTAQSMAHDGYSLREIGEALGVSFKTVSNWLNE